MKCALSGSAWANCHSRPANGAMRAELREGVWMAAVDERVDVDGMHAHGRIPIGDLADA